MIGRVRATIHSRAELTIYADFLLFLCAGLSDAGREHARDLLEDYDVSQHGRNIYNYLEQQRDNARLTDNDYIVEPGLRLEKNFLDESSNGDRPWERLKGYLIDVDAGQRERLFTEYAVDGGQDSQTRVDIIRGADRNGDWSGPPLPVIINEQSITLAQSPESRRIVESDSATTAPNEHDVDPGFTNNSSDVSRFIDDLVNATTGDTCPPSDMRRKDLRIMTILSYPEFRVIWKRATIKIGCARISFKYPVIQTRTAKRVLYGHYSIPKDLGYTLFRIAESCAIRAALAGAVIGIVLGNPGAAAVSFESLFKACVKRELEKCINAGLSMLKEVSPWP